MSNLRIINQNSAKLATLTASTEAGTLVVENLQDDRKGVVWRSTANTATTITAEWTDAQFVNAVILPFCNLTSTATMQVELFTNVADVTPVYDSGAVACCGHSSFDVFDWGGAPLGVNAFSVGGGTYARVYTDIHVVKKVIITIVDTGNSSAYIESGCLVIGKYWSPTTNAAYGANISISSTNKIERSHAGDSILTQGTLHKSLDFNLEWLDAVDRDYENRKATSERV